MLKILSEKLGMIMQVQTLLRRIQPVVEPVLPLITPERVKINDLVDAIISLGGEAGKDNTGVAEDKQALREKLTAEAYKVGNAAALYYTLVMSDQTLRARALLSQTQMKRLSADALVNKTRLIYQTALPIKTLLLPYGVDATTVDGLPAHIEAFFNAKELPAEERALKKTANKDLQKLFKDADVVLERLDMIFRVLHSSHPMEYMQYKMSRKIQQLPTNRIMKQGLLQPASRSVANYARGYLKPQTSITLINESARTKGAALQFYFAAKKGDLPASAQPIIEVSAGAEKTIPIAKHGFSEATPVLMVFNPSTKKVRWKTRVVLKEKK